MFDWLATWLDQLGAFIEALWTFFASGIYDFAKEVMVLVTKAMIYAYIQSMIFMADIGYQVTQEIMQEVGITSAVTSAWGSLPADIRGTLSFFNIPQGLTVIFSAIPTRWAMKFIPGAGK